MMIWRGLGNHLVVALAIFFLLSFRAAAQDKVIARVSAEPSRAIPDATPAKSPAQPAKTLATTNPANQLTKTAAAPVKRARKKVAKPRYPTYGNPAEGDDPSRDDPVVRAAAKEALGNLMGSVVVVDPSSGRVLSVVNQPLAFGGGYQPCSAFKPAVALAALGEGIIENDRTKLELGKKWHLDLHKALAISNNLYFEKLGRLLGIGKLEQYAHQFGFGEQAGWGIDPEPAGAFPAAAPPAKAGGVGRVASFGQGISVTMFQLASFVSALSNGGTLYYLQYPATGQVQEFTPLIKRDLPIGSALDVVRSGMEEAVLTGTARRAKQPDMRLVGKTGTCSQDGARLGWFAGYNREPGGVAIVVLLRTGQNLGGGSRASQVAGQVFRRLGDENYYARSSRRGPSPPLPASIQIPNFP
ncbi:MAG: penicillin-binding protein [Acidobacteria bacterium]|nr:penicillin-binding protein [Acidobacteriota bacterium]